MTRVLVVDDDERLCQQLRGYLVQEGMVVDLAHDGWSGLRSALIGQHDVVVLSVTLPGLTGLQVTERLRAHSSVGILMLNARGKEVDKIVALESGADDYLDTPFSPREFIARIRAITRRVRRSVTCELAAAPECFEIGDLALDEGSRECRRNGRIIDLTTAEFDLLSALLRCSGRVIHRRELSKKVLDREYSPFDRSIDVHVSSLRRKLGDLPEGTERIRSVRNVGYIYAHPARLFSRPQSASVWPVPSGTPVSGD